MELRDVSNTILDLSRAGLVIGKKALASAFADERRIDPAAVSELMGRLHPKRIGVTVSEVIEETSSTRTLRLVPDDGNFVPFRAGQFVNVFLTVEGVDTSRPYSISSPPSRFGSYDITVREMKDGFVSKYLLEEAGAGDRFELAGPAGFFYHDPMVDTDDLVFLAGGSGITPFMSMMRNAVDTGQELGMHLLYGSRVPDDVIFMEELEDIACRESNIKVDLVISEPPEGYDGPCGFLDADMIKKLVGDVKGKTFYLCGPHAMYDLCTCALSELGVEERRIKQELSGPPPDITAVEGWPEKVKGDEEFKVKIEGRSGSLTVRSGEPLLNSLERNNVTIENLCRSGECGMCRTRLVEGEVFMPPAVTLRKADAVFGYIHPCMTYPLSDLTLRL